MLAGLDCTGNFSLPTTVASGHCHFVRTPIPVTRSGDGGEHAARWAFVGRSKGTENGPGYSLVQRRLTTPGYSSGAKPFCRVWFKLRPEHIAKA